MENVLGAIYEKVAYTTGVIIPSGSLGARHATSESESLQKPNRLVNLRTNGIDIL